MERQIGFLGGGAMAEAIISGITAAGLLAPHKIFVYEPNTAKAAALHDKYGVLPCRDAQELLQSCNVLLLAVKPQIFPVAVTPAITAAVSQDTLIVSIMGSVTIKQLKDKFTKNRIIRTMPNTPLAVSAGMTAIAPASEATAEDISLVQRIFDACGQTAVVTESQIEAITALSGCGPGYVFMLIDALADAGVSAGLTRDMSIQLAAQTFLGSGKMVLETGEHPCVLRDKVTSPGGTTIAGIRMLEQCGVRSAFIESVHAVIKRSQEIINEKK